MVHALEDIHRLLRPDGSLIDIHPMPMEEPIELLQDGSVVFSEPPPDQDDDWEDYRKTEAALTNVIARRLYMLEGSRDFRFSMYSSSVAELNDFIADANAYWDCPKDPGVAARSEDFYARVDKIMQVAGEGTEIANREPARVSRLRALK